MEYPTCRTDSSLSDVFQFQLAVLTGRGATVARHIWVDAEPDIDKPLSMSLQARCYFYVRDTGNRGPLLLHADRSRHLGYLDEDNYWLGDDEHDLNFRAYATHRWVSGYCPLDFDAPLAAGGTRRKPVVVETVEENEYRKFRIRRCDKKLGALNQFISQKWLTKDSCVILDASADCVNLGTLMSLGNYSKKLDDIHDETRPLRKCV